MIPNDFLPIANHLWQSTLFAGVAAFLTLFLRNNRAHARYCLWLAASAKFLVPFSLLMLVGGLAGPHTASMHPPARVPLIVAQVNEPFVAELSPMHFAMPQASKPGIPVVPMLAALWAIGCGALVFSWGMRCGECELSSAPGRLSPWRSAFQCSLRPRYWSLGYSVCSVQCCYCLTALAIASHRRNSVQFSPTSCVMFAAATICGR